MSLNVEILNDQITDIPKSEIPNVGVDDIGDLVAEKMPKVETHVVQAQTEADTNIKFPVHPKTKKPIKVDIQGESFNPDIHKTDKDGNPIATKEGFLARKRGIKAQPGRVKTPAEKIKEATAKFAPENQELEPAHPAQPAQAVSPSDTRYASARTAAAVFFAIGRQIGGDEWEPMSGKIDLGNGQFHHVDEQRDVERVFFNYFTAKGIDNLPPEAELLVVLGGSILIRAQKPATKSFLKKQFENLKKLFAWAKNKFPKRKTNVPGTV